jgi:hypothetical protein
VASLAALVPYLAFTRARLDARLASVAGAPHAVVHASEAGLLLHFALMGVIGAVIIVELKTGVFTTLFSLTTVALRASPRTVIDVLQTLPLVLTVLFFVAFMHDTWETFGLLNPPQLTLLVLLLFGCVVCVVIRAARAEVKRLDDPAAAQPSATEDETIKQLSAAGATVEPLRVDGAVRKALERQWTFQISLCILAAGIIVAAVIWLASGLAMNRAEARSWLDKAPSKVLDVAVWKVHFFLTWQGLVVAIMLGAFASLVFAGAAIAQDDSRGELFRGERMRLRRMLLLAGTYQNAVERGLWGARPGMTWWQSYYAFLADDPERWHTEPVEFGTAWSEANSPKQWRAAWNSATGELYVHRRKRAPVEVLATCKDRVRLDAALAGWEEHQRRYDSLGWLRGQAKSLENAALGSGVFVDAQIGPGWTVGFHGPATMTASPAPGHGGIVAPIAASDPSPLARN